MFSRVRFTRSKVRPLPIPMLTLTRKSCELQKREGSLLDLCKTLRYLYTKFCLNENKTTLRSGYAILSLYLIFKNTVSVYRNMGRSRLQLVYHLRRCQRWLNRLEYKFARVSNVTMTTAVVGMQGGENGVEL